MLAALGGLVGLGRDPVSTRTAECRSCTKAQGKHMGRPPSLTPAQQKEATSGAHRARRCKNWHTATAAESLPCAAPRAPRERISGLAAGHVRQAGGDSGL